MTEIDLIKRSLRLSGRLVATLGPSTIAPLATVLSRGIHGSERKQP